MNEGLLQFAEEGLQCSVELLRLLQRRQMGSVVNDSQRGTGDSVVQRLGLCNGSDFVIAAADNQCRRSDFRKHGTGFIPSGQCLQPGDHRSGRCVQNGLMNVTDGRFLLCKATFMEKILQRCFRIGVETGRFN